MMSTANGFFEPLESRQLLASSGFSASYFDGLNFSGAAVSRVDRNVNFNFGHTRPAPGIRGNTYSVRWTGMVQASATDTFTFSLRHTDGARLWVGGVKLIDRWVNGNARTDTGTLPMRNGHWYDIRIEFFDYTNSAQVRLTWHNSTTTTSSYVPTKRLLSY